MLDLSNYTGYFEELFKNNPLGILLCDSNNKVLKVNQAFCDMFGYSEDEVIGKFVDDVVVQSPELRSPAADVTKEALQGKIVSFEAIRERKDGTRFWASILSAPVYTEGVITGIFAIYSDISEQKQLQKNLEDAIRKNTAIMDVFPDYVMILDSEGNILDVSSTPVEQTNINPGEFVGKNFREIGFRKEANDIIASRLSKALKSSEIQVFTISLNTPSDVTHLEIRFIKMGEDRILAVMRDVTTETENKIRLENFVNFNRSLLEVTKDVLKTTDIENMYQLLLEKAVDIVPGAEAGSLILKDKDGLYRFYAAVNYDLRMLKKIYLKPEELVQKEVHEVQIVTDFNPNRKLDKFRYEILERYGKTSKIKAMLSVPIETDGKIIGFFGLDSHSSATAFNEDSTEMAKLLGQQVAVLFERLRLEKELRKQKERLELLSGKDPLTGLPNRRLFFEKAHSYLALSKRNHMPLSILYLDLDYFKIVNDTMGHDIGDEVLSIVAKRLQYALRESDVVARLGGDEFIFVLPETDFEAAKVVKKRIEFILREVINLRCGIVTVGGSIGISTFPDDGDDLEQLIKIADQRMYECKKSKKAQNK
ncbi:sensor domain-containing diguanylate cyclase [Kosmotoga pacifica]|uniref:sensor domain-containing diguanylate cyclase n=1 Tax=Kosmotoga pacifica TaxID=1330330 RepID=UPI00069A4BE3|nr:diguanylate cyclase [Kosmotoga pacifica]